MQAGIKTLPLILSMIVSTIVCARITQTVGYYVPAMLLSPLFCSVGIGLLTTLNAEAGPSKWIGYQVLCGIGIGAAFQSPSLAVQAVLPRADVPLGTGLVFLNQQLGGAVFLSAAQNIFSNKLTSQLSGVTELDAEIIFQTGVNELYDVVQPNEVSSVVEAYNYAITRIFIMGTALSALTIVGASVMEWKNINMKPVAKEEPKGESSRIKPDNGNQAA
jgi:hypothetical protein